MAPNLSRFRLSDEHLISSDKIKAEISRAFSENRAFQFYPDINLIERIRSGESTDNLKEDILKILHSIYNTISGDNQTLKNRFLNDALLSKRLLSALNFFHIAAADAKLDNISKRRIVIIKELPGIPTIFHVSDETTVISRVGQGPVWAEIPTIYLGLNTFDTLLIEHKKGDNRLFDSFKTLLMVEERAIETGFSHVVAHPPEVSKALNYLVNRVIKHVTQYEIEIKEIPEKKPFKKFTKKNRDAILKDLNARLKGDELNFDHKKCLRAVQSLEKLSRLYKNNSDIDSIREVVRLLVAASGHDIHEIRNRSNIILERIFSPKEFDAPLAVKFINTTVGTDYTFSFDLPESRGRYILRIYKNSTGKEFILNNDIDSEDIPLLFNKENNRFTGKYKFEEYGHYDFAVLIKKKKKTEWTDNPETNGRVNVLPDLKGRIILEIFTDIHGHTKAYWHDETGHPGLLYNENGEVIRLGTFDDISAHLEDIKNKYCITDLYLLGVQKRGFNRENWAPGATSPSPFSPLSLTHIEPKLGGEKALKALIKKAHSLDIKIIVDIIPHINRKSGHLPENLIVKTYGTDGRLYARSATDGKYGSWDDGKLVNFRKFEVWQWMARSITTLIEKFDIDGIRFDSAHAVPIMMKKNNFLYVYDKKRTEEEMVEGDIIVNDRENDHFITTGYYDSACRDQISVPFHYFIMLAIQKKLKEKNKGYFINIAECYWGHERFLTRTGLIPYNSALFKICENIIHGKSDVREIYHIYDNYFPSALPEGTELLGILGNHDERRALNTFGHRGLRPAVALTSFMSSIIMDYEGSAEGEGWKVFLDNIYVNWNQFEYASHRSLENFYREWYQLHRNSIGKGYLVWANNNMVAASMKFTRDAIWLGAFNFADSNQYISIQFDNPVLPICDDDFFRISDIVFSEITGRYSYYKGSELKISRLNTVVSYTDRIKLLKLEKTDIRDHYHDFIKDSFIRLCEMSDTDKIFSNFSFSEMSRHCGSYDSIEKFLTDNLIPLFWDNEREKLEHGLKRAVFYLYKNNLLSPMNVRSFSKMMIESGNEKIRELGKALKHHNERGAIVFMSAEAEPFSKSGGLANVVYELPRELHNLG